MNGFDCTLPPLLAKLHEIEVDYADDEGIEFEPYDAFESATFNASWMQAWTGNKQLDGAAYRFFGKDGSGGLAGLWLIRPELGLLSQPIVFFGSDGEKAVIAYDFADYLWLLAAGIGPLEAVLYGAEERAAQPQLAAFAADHAALAKKSPSGVLERAKKAFPTFVQDLEATCR